MRAHVRSRKSIQIREYRYQMARRANVEVARAAPVRIIKPSVNVNSVEVARAAPAVSNDKDISFADWICRYGDPSDSRHNNLIKWAKWMKQFQ